MSKISNQTVYLVKYTLDTVRTDSDVHGIRELAKSVSDKITDTEKDVYWLPEFIKEVRFVLNLSKENTVVSSKMTFLIGKSIDALSKEDARYTPSESLKESIERIIAKEKKSRPYPPPYDRPYFYGDWYPIK